jgi:hypothetical protein
MIFLPITFAITEIDTGVLPHVTAEGAAPINTILTIVFGLMGTVSLLIIILAGLRLITSQGQPEKLNKARDTIIYAAIGLAVSLGAYGIVTFVINKL